MKFTEPMNRPLVQTPYPPRSRRERQCACGRGRGTRICLSCKAKKFSWHNEFSANPGDPRYVNPVTGKGPIEGRPPGEFFAHQRWTASGPDSDLFPKVGYLMSIGQCEAGTPLQCRACRNRTPIPSGRSGRGYPAMSAPAAGSRLGYGAPCLFKLRYGEPAVTRIYNDLPDDRTQNGGFGRNEISTHFHNAHHGAESDGASNAYHFPGTFYDYHWSLALARRDLTSVRADRPIRAIWTRRPGPTDGGGLQLVEGDFRELQGSLWVHDHRFFFTAENVHKGMFALANIYSGPDRGCERTLNDGINLRLPSGWLNGKSWGNTDFDVNLAVSNPARRQDGQLFFDIFDTDGFLGDMLCVNGGYYPYFEVLPRRYRFRILNASMSRFIKLALVVNRSAIRARHQGAVPLHRQ